MKEKKWIMMRGGEVTNIFPNRIAAVKHLKKMLKQTLKDFEGQDKTDCQYDYSINVPETIIKPVEEREAWLGLLK